MRTKAFMIIFGLVLIVFNFNFSYGLSCNNNADCNNGTCNNGSCTCITGYVDYNNAPCSYQQKEKLSAFLLSFLIGSTGADWFYLSNGNGGYIAGGIFKLLTGISGCILPCILCCFGIIGRGSATKKAIGAICAMGFVIICTILNVIWVTVDWIRILADGFNDGNGIALKSW